MSIRRLVFSLFAVLLGVSALPSGATSQMGVNEIRPGMVGISRTVFDGTHVEEFKAHIIGVLENVIGTHRNLILAKLEGGPLANTGVIAGMSGSRTSFMGSPFIIREKCLLVKEKWAFMVDTFHCLWYVSGLCGWSKACPLVV